MSIWFVLWIALFGCLAVVTFLMEANRTRRLKEWASQNGFASLGKALPRSIDLEGVGYREISSIWNVYEGKAGGFRIVLFDCRIGQGKGSWRRTMIAAQAPRDVFTNIPSELGMTIDHQEGWQILYRSLVPSFGLRPFMPVEEIEARIRAIHHASGSE